MSRAIHCGWCGIAGHRIDRCNDIYMRDLYSEHVNNGKFYFNYNNNPLIVNFNFYVLSMSRYSLKHIKAIASYSGFIVSIPRVELTNLICKQVFRKIDDYNRRHNIIINRRPLNVLPNTIEPSYISPINITEVHTIPEVYNIPRVEYTYNPINDINCCEILNNDDESKEQQTECCICYDDNNINMFVEFNCNHKTCINCFDQLLSYKSKTASFPTRVSMLNINEAHNNIITNCTLNCPMCRGRIGTIYALDDTLSRVNYIKNKYVDEFKKNQDIYLQKLLTIKNNNH
jgi:hypothetical protein